MNSVQTGTAIAVAVAGWPLYQLVTSGDLDATTALLRGGIVAAGCVYGVTLVVRLATKYETEADLARKRKLDRLFTDMEGAVAEGALTSDDEQARPGPGGTEGAGSR